MTKYECAAHISERGTVTGKAGDQTGREVSVTPYSNYSPGGYNCVMRYYGDKALKVRNRIVMAAIRLAKNPRIGYSQPTRNTLYEQMQDLEWSVNKCKKVQACNTDCSAFVGVVINVALVPLGLYSPIPDDIWTGNESRYLLARGFDYVTRGVNLNTGVGLLPGDILINFENHTTICIGDSPKGQLIKPTTTEKPANETESEKKTLDVVAHEVIDGIWGNGEDRKSALKRAGYDYDKVQARVNQLLSLEGC